MQSKKRVGVIFGGRSGEHEVSLMSSRSVLAVLDPQKYEVFQIGITRQGAWVTGADVWSALDSGNLDGLSPALILPEPGRATLYALRGSTLEPSARWTCSSRFCTAPLARTAPCRACSNWPTWLTSARACSAHPSGWTKPSSKT